MHDNDNPCCTAEQSAWLDVVTALRTHIMKGTDKKSKIALNTLGGLVELTSCIMQLHVLASSFDDAVEAQRAKQRKRTRSFE